MIIITGRARHIRVSLLSPVVSRHCFSPRCKQSSNLYKLTKHISRTPINPPVFNVSTHCDWLKKTNSQKVCLLVQGFDLLVLYCSSSWFLKLFSSNQRASLLSPSPLGIFCQADVAEISMVKVLCISMSKEFPVKTVFPLKTSLNQSCVN